MRKTYRSSEQMKAPLSGAVEAHGLVFVSGQVHLNEAGQLEGKTVEEKLALVIANMTKILAEAGLTLEHVVSVRLFLTDLSELPALNKAYPTYFSQPMPARTTVGVAALPLGATLEIDAIAVRPQ
jgi:2-iminobutanoate/2-iminopropanoate deaminase